MRILVVDDELLAIKSIIRSLQKLNYNEIYQADNGIDAVQLIHKIKPDIVLADIRMPGMDGIELLTNVKECYENIFFIFISGYDLFEYAQKAVSLGALNYLLKPIDEDALKSALDKASQIIARQAQQKSLYSQLKIKINQEHEHMKRDFLSQFLNHANFSSKDWEDKCKDFNIYLPFDAYCVIIINIDDFKLSLSNLSAKEIELTKFTIENISTEFFYNAEVHAHPFNIDEGIGYLLNFSSGNQNFCFQSLYEICCKIKEYINQHYHCSLTIGIGKIVTTPSQLYHAFVSSSKTVSQRLLKGNNHVICFQEFNTQREVFQMVTPVLEQELKLCFEKENFQAAFDLIKDLYSQFKKADSIDPSVLMKLNLHLIMLISRVSHGMGINFDKTIGDEFLLYNEVNTCNSINLILQWFECKLRICFEAIHCIILQGSKKISDKVKDYISSTYSVITLEAAADYVHLNPSYFSKVFKQETGENFIDYLVSFRINQAKLLLKTNSYKANEICKLVGFNDVKHFFKVFKKHTGYTPNDYRNIWFSNVK